MDRRTRGPLRVCPHTGPDASLGRPDGPLHFSERPRCCRRVSKRSPFELGAVLAVAAEEVGPAISEGHVRALRDSTYSLLDAAPATTRLRSHLAHGKIVLTMS